MSHAMSEHEEENMLSERDEKLETVVCICPECDCEAVIDFGDDPEALQGCHSCGYALTTTAWHEYETELEP